ncbi:uncharacterized protein LOC128881369 [Hylaeus volcanicus]|uniref:uncharacterized protein LOC128881369 n=1 Tax=Hylaeus volcanicus TaxID=313075 RepID=UPI0023B80B0E|nr:uncharacterized protein LOC128881369 [Hylaeus volcanicus]XP_053988319.1 uncharacterized protein LOC128881369 [Hylaeus volcanicus]
MKLRHSSRKDTRSPMNTCTCIKATSDPPIRDQSIAAIRANMIEIVFLLLLGICGASSTPVASYADGNLSNHTEMDLSPLPGSGNLAEKAIPLWQLIDNEKPLLPAIQIAMEEPRQTTHKLPGTNNLAEKRIPDVILKKFSHPQATRSTDDTFVL